jgi:hypothetical protein
MTVTNGVLVADLDCSAEESAVSVLDRGTLDLAGHTIVGGSQTAIECHRRCTIDGGGGLVTSSGNWGVSSIASGSIIRISNLDILSETPQAIFCGVLADSVELTGTTIDGAGAAVQSKRRVSLTDSQITGSIIGVSSTKRLTIVGSTLTGNDWATGNLARLIEVSNSTISGNSVSGLRGKRVRASASIVDGNGTSCSAADPLDCADIASASRPRLKDVTCSTSSDLASVGGGNFEPTGESWRTCSLD